MSRRKKLTYLTQPRSSGSWNAATELHRTCCDPVIARHATIPSADGIEPGNRRGYRGSHGRQTEG
jgi:hypothetical protein